MRHCFCPRSSRIARQTASRSHTACTDYCLIHCIQITMGGENQSPAVKEYQAADKVTRQGHTRPRVH